MTDESQFPMAPPCTPPAHLNHLGLYPEHRPVHPPVHPPCTRSCVGQIGACPRWVFCLCRGDVHPPAQAIPGLLPSPGAPAQLTDCPRLAFCLSGGVSTGCAPPAQGPLAMRQDQGPDRLRARPRGSHGRRREKRPDGRSQILMIFPKGPEPRPHVFVVRLRSAAAGMTLSPRPCGQRDASRL